MSKTSKQRVILAVDLKAGDLSQAVRTWKALKAMYKTDANEIEPVCVLNREDLAFGKLLKKQIGDLKAATERHLGEQLAELGLQGLAQPKVIFADGSSTQRAVDSLLNYAKECSCDLIAVSSHNRKGLKRLFLGSFAETLSLQSPIPILVLNPNERIESRAFDTVLFPTDFSPKSKEGLEMVCRSLQGHKRKIIIFNSFLFQKYVFPVEVYMGVSASSEVPESVYQDELKRIQKIGESWCKYLREQGFIGELVIDRKSNFAAEGILTAAKRKKVGLIAMVSTTGKAGAILGSVTRQILRSSPRPVWIVHPTKPFTRLKPLRLLSQTVSRVGNDK